MARPLDDDVAAAARVAADLLDTMRAFPGCVGIAAPQIDELVRVVAVDVSEHPKAPPSANGELVLVDPLVTRAAGAKVATEIVVAARTPDGSAVAIESAGFEARCLLHEIDHLDGLLFLDRVDSLATDVFRRKSARK